MTLYEDSSDLWAKSPESREWRSPLSTWEDSFSEGSPLIFERIEVGPYFRLRWWWICSLWCRRELRPLWAEIFIIFGGGGDGDYWIESKGCLFSVSVNFDSRDTQTLFLMVLQRVETRQEYNSWPPDPSPSRPVSHPVTVISNIVSLALCSIKALQASFKAIWGTSWTIG